MVLGNQDKALDQFRSRHQSRIQYPSLTWEVDGEIHGILGTLQRVGEVNRLLMPNVGISKPARSGSGWFDWRCGLLSDMGRVQVPSDSCVGSLVARKRSRTEVYQLPHAESQTLRRIASVRRRTEAAPYIQANKPAHRNVAAGRLELPVG